MHADLDRLIRLQQIDLFSENARRRIADHPDLVEGLDARLASATAALDAARAKVADNQANRRAVEKDLSMITARLSKFKDQLMEVKTNKEYTAMLKEIEAAQTELRRLEDRLLERMLEADDLAAVLKDAERRLAADKAAIAIERQQLEEETVRMQRELDEAVSSRAQVVADMSPAALSTYETVRSRRGSAVAEVRGGYCSACHVRLRPQIANELRKQDTIFQCESCQRFLYHPPAALEPEAGAGH
jgi:predicted  nucleic acid-binding Zn-ribbon protein